MIGFVIGEMDLEQMEMVVDVADQARLASQQQHGADAARGEAPDALAQLIMDVAGGHHGLLAFGAGPMSDAVEESPPAFPQESAIASSPLLAVASAGLVQHNNHHSKPSVTWKN